MPLAGIFFCKCCLETFQSVVACGECCISLFHSRMSMCYSASNATDERKQAWYVRGEGTSHTSRRYTSASRRESMNRLVNSVSRLEQQSRQMEDLGNASVRDLGSVRLCHCFRSLSAALGGF